MNQPLKILRYNTGTDKKAFVQFKDKFDAVIFNASIVAYSGASVADLVSMHARKYIIDPQTHIFQQDMIAITTEDKKTHVKSIKKSVKKYLDNLPEPLKNKIEQGVLPLSSRDIEDNIKDLVQKVYTFQTEYVNVHIKEKDYNKYLSFAELQPEPMAVIAPYFMIKKGYPLQEQQKWLELNKKSLEETLSVNNNKHPIAAQLVLDETVLSDDFANKIGEYYNVDGYEYVFIWINDFNSFETKLEYMSAFSKLIKNLNEIGKKPIMAYGGYESILLCNHQSPYRLYGVAQSVGYGEYRAITPVGGGMPVNKYYFYPLHKRLNFDDAAKILSAKGYFNNAKTVKAHALNYYNAICDCDQCREIIQSDIHNFDRYNDSTPFDVTTKYGKISRNRPTTDASLYAANHFLFCKVKEWDCVKSNDFSELLDELIKNFDEYLPNRQQQISEWCKIYGQKEL